MNINLIICFLFPLFTLGQTGIDYYESGQKKEDFLNKDRIVNDTLKKWTPAGELLLKQIYSDSGFTEINYYYKVGRIYETGNYVLLQGKSDEVIIIDSTKFDKYVSVKCSKKCYQRIGTWTTFHINGQIESQGQYLPQKFETSYPKDGNNKSFEMEPDIIYETVNLYIKDKIWLYYDENGNKIKEELYIDGLLKK